MKNKRAEKKVWFRIVEYESHVLIMINHVDQNI
jgi:hypothetical protein